jgi:hypothetical protein
MRVPRHGPPLLVCACLSACNRDYPNPFERPNATATPGPNAAAVFTSDSWSARPGAPRELFAIDEDGASVTRLTFCNSDSNACDTSEAAFGRDRTRVALRRIVRDTTGDGRLTPADGEALVYVDLLRSLEGPLGSGTSEANGVTGLDWSPVQDILVYSAFSAGDFEDLFIMDSNGQNRSPLTSTPAIGERRPRIDPFGGIVAFERLDATGLGAIWIFLDRRSQVPVTAGGTPGEPLTGTRYRVGGDADPDFSPSRGSLVFRRLTALGNGGRGTWDLLTVRSDGTALSTIASGPRYRGAPDWGPRGILFEEVDEGGQASLVLLSPDGSTRRTLATLGAGFGFSFPRWLQ